MQDKLLTESGGKALQTDGCKIDRELHYNNWLRSPEVHLWATDVDTVMFRSVDGEVRPYALVDVTMSNIPFFDINETYRQRITQRYFSRDCQGTMMLEICRRMRVPGYLLLYAEDMIAFWVYSFQHPRWKQFMKEDWKEYLDKLPN